MEQPPTKGFKEGWGEGWAERPYDLDSNQWDRLFHNSAFNPQNVKRAFAKEYGASAAAGHLAAAFLKDVTTDGTRVAWWALNHPLAITSMFSEGASRAAGLAPDMPKLQREYMAAHSDRAGTREQLLDFNARKMGWHQEGRAGIPAVLAQKAIPALAATAIVQASGNHDFLNLAEGGRAPGFRAVLNEGDPTQTSNVPGELAARYVLGRRGSLLPWDQFTQERPEISEADYLAYKRHQHSRGLLGVAKATPRNLEGEPEFEMMGFRTPMSAATTGGGAMVGGIAGARLADALREEMGVVNPQTKSIRRGPMRLAGAVLGSGLGMIGGNLGGKAVNATIIQPIVAPERQQAQRLWEEQQRQAGNL